MNDAYRILNSKAELRGWLTAFGVPYTRAKRIANYCARFYRLALKWCNEDVRAFDEKEGRIREKIIKEFKEWTEKNPFEISFFYDPRGAVVVFKHLETGREFHF